MSDPQYNIFRSLASIIRLSLIVTCLFVFHSGAIASVLDPQADLYRSQGLAEQERGRYQAALNHFLKAASIGPESAVLLNDIAINYENLGFSDRAEQFYLRAIKTDPNYLPAYTNIAYLYSGLGHTDKAIQFFQERLRRGTQPDPWRQRILDELYHLNPALKDEMIRQQMEETARKLAEQAEQKEREEFRLSLERSEEHFRRGEIQRMQKNYKQAVEEFESALKITPDNPKMLNAIERARYDERIDEVKHRIAVAIDQLDKGKIDSAKKEFQQILAIIPKEAVQSN